ncbi:hypothetical protein IW262DRAFT_1018435 [Armillaria fumosa]|nr:hypothetical protein IW262DRAFT_1018435 [Armillaria fumosa]
MDDDFRDLYQYIGVAVPAAGNARPARFERRAADERPQLDSGEDSPSSPNHHRRQVKGKRKTKSTVPVTHKSEDDADFAPIEAVVTPMKPSKKRAHTPSKHPAVSSPIRKKRNSAKPAFEDRSQIARTPSPLPKRHSTRQTPKVKAYVEEDSDEEEEDQVDEEQDEQEDESEAEVEEALVADVSLPPVSDGDDEVAKSGSDD